MNKVPSIITSVLLSIPGLVVFFLNPFRSVNFIVGLAIQLAVVALLFFLAIPQGVTMEKYVKLAKEDLKENRTWLIVGLVVYAVCAGVILYGIQSTFWRFVLLFFMWMGALSSAEMSGFFAWRHFNRAALDERLAKDAAEEEQAQLEKEKAQKAQQERGAREQAEREQQRQLEEEKVRKQEQEHLVAEQKAQDEEAQHRKAEQEVREEIERRERAQAEQRQAADPRAKDPKLRLRNLASPDPDLLKSIRNGNVSALDTAIRAHTPEALAAIEEAIAQHSGDTDPAFFRQGRPLIEPQVTGEAAHARLLDLIAEGKLLADPAVSQSLISGLGSSELSTQIMYELDLLDKQALFEYRLLGVQMQLATLVDRDVLSSLLNKAG